MTEFLKAISVLGLNNWLDFSDNGSINLNVMDDFVDRVSRQRLTRFRSGVRSLASFRWKRPKK